MTRVLPPVGCSRPAAEVQLGLWLGEVLEGEGCAQADVLGQKSVVAEQSDKST